LIVVSFLFSSAILVAMDWFAIAKMMQLISSIWPCKSPGCALRFLSRSKI
jgi:hypothetical protein